MTQRPAPRPPLDEFTARRALRDLTATAEGVQKSFPGIGMTVDSLAAGDMLPCYLRSVCCQETPCPRMIDDPHTQALVTAWLDWYAPEGVTAP